MNRLIVVENEVEGLKAMLLGVTQNADAAKSAVQKNSSRVCRRSSANVSDCSRSSTKRRCRSR